MTLTQVEWVLSQITFTEILKTVFAPNSRKNPAYHAQSRGVASPLDLYFTKFVSVNMWVDLLSQMSSSIVTPEVEHEGFSEMERRETINRAVYTKKISRELAV